MIYETTGFAIEKYVGLKPKMYSFLVGDCSAYKKAKGSNWNIAEKITHNEYKDALLNNKPIRKDHLIGTHEISKISLSCFDDKIYIKKPVI